MTRNFTGILVDYYKHGIIEEVKECDHVNPGEIHYLSHKVVYRTDKETTKTRIVFDASAKNGHEPSLNDVLYSGQCLLLYLFDILLRFRIVKIALVADIKQAFLQIEINEKHRDYLRFLWYKDVFTDNPILTIFRFARGLFGLTSSPFLLSATVRYHKSQYKEVYPRTDLIQKFLRDSYVDDSTTSFHDLETATEFYNKIKRYMLDA